MNHVPLSFAILVLAVGPTMMVCAEAANNGDAIAFSRANAGKFRTEVAEVRGISVGKTITVSGNVDWIDVMSLRLKYDPDSQIATPSYLASFGSLKFDERCVPKGSFTGSNAFGVRRAVSRQECERFFVTAYPSNWIDLNGMHVPMTPTQFRAVQKNGFSVEVDFVVMHQDDITVTSDSSFSPATLDEPVETRMRVWTIHGDFQAVRWKLPSSGVWIEIWKSRTRDVPPKPSTAVAGSLNSAASAQAYDDPVCGTVMPFAEAAYQVSKRGVAQSDAVAHASAAHPQFSNYWQAFVAKAYGAASVEEAKAAVYAQCLAMKTPLK